MHVFTHPTYGWTTAKITLMHNAQHYTTELQVFHTPLSNSSIIHVLDTYFNRVNHLLSILLFIQKHFPWANIAPVGMEIYILSRPRFRFKLYAYVCSKLNNYSKLTMNLYHGCILPRMYTTWIGHISFFTNIIAYA